MSSLSTLWRRATENRTASVSACAAVVALGVVLIAVGEVLDWGWTRLIGAGVISVGSVLAGVLIGWSEPIRPRIAGLLRQWSRAIVWLLTAIMVAPLLVGLLVAFGGIANGADDWLLLGLGVLIVALMLGVTGVTVWLAVSLALRGVTKTTGANGARANGEEDA
jgi:hypothetical protein